MTEHIYGAHARYTAKRQHLLSAIHGLDGVQTDALLAGAEDATRGVLFLARAALEQQLRHVEQLRDGAQRRIDGIRAGNPATIADAKGTA